MLCCWRVNASFPHGPRSLALRSPIRESTKHSRTSCTDARAAHLSRCAGSQVHGCTGPWVQGSLVRLASDKCQSTVPKIAAQNRLRVAPKPAVDDTRVDRPEVGLERHVAGVVLERGV